MNSLLVILTAAAAVCIITALVSLICMTVYLDRRGKKTPLVLLGLRTFRILSQYREQTRQEKGRTGVLYYTFVIPVNTALLLAVILILWGR